MVAATWVLNAVLWDPNSGPGWHDWLGLALTVFGFAIAFWQLKKTKSASETATAELNRARKKLNTDQLSAVVNQMQIVVADIDFAIDSNDREVAHRALLRFSYVAKEAEAILGNLEPDHGPLQTRLTETSSKALDAKSSIVGRPNADVARTAKAVGVAVSSLTVEISGLIASDRYQLGEDARV
ncbi:hypothetical protein ACFSWE_05005 [Leucobacter albus]|uniref:Uncharacterized protein n=1 Tax=Leucobacter albus TaxID=272210 RepID=A0ABW3TK32_9MICO